VSVVPANDDLGTDTASAVLVLLTVFGVAALAAFLIAYVVLSACLMPFFRKVGVAPGLAWVPVVNLWKWLEVGGLPGAIALLTLVPWLGLITAVFIWIGMYRTGIAFGKDAGWLVLGIVVPFVWCLLLARPSEVYRPELLAAVGKPLPRAGFGALPRG
jgi:hypothetical protein